MYAKSGVADRADHARGKGCQQDRGIGWHYIVLARLVRTRLAHAWLVDRGTNVSTSMSLVACLWRSRSSKPGDGPQCSPTSHTRVRTGSPGTSSQPGPGRTTTRTYPGCERGHDGAKLQAFQVR